MKSLVALIVSFAAYAPALAEDPIEIGSRRELFVDQFLIESLDGNAKQIVQQPKPQEVVLVTDKPWEGNTCAYYAIFQDGDKYRMYYRGSHYDTEKRKGTHPEVVCYAESTDGINWVKPELGIIEYDGSKANNIVWDGIGRHCFTPFKDANPDSAPEARYKAVSRGRPDAKKGLYLFQSPDGLNWSLMREEPVITEGAFDSQNLAFWDTHAKLYRCYHRDFRKVRDIKWQTSEDFINWTAPEFLDYGDTPLEHLYTNAIRNDPRAPHILIGFPTRYLPSEGQRVEPTFMSSRDGKTFHRWREPVIPESAPEDRGGNRSNYMTWGLLELPGRPDEYSVYATEAYYTGPDSRVRRFTYRKDGYVAIASEGKGELITKPFTFKGNSLSVNFAPELDGFLKVELQTAEGRPIAGLTEKNCAELKTDGIDQAVSWGEAVNLAQWQGRAVRLKFVLNNAKLYSFKFGE